jgi:hypothetical protein
MHRDTIHPHDLMKPDLLGEIVLAGSAMAMFLPLLLLIVFAVTRATTLGN